MRDNPRARPDLIPVGRFGTVDEVADVVVMLAANSYNLIMLGPQSSRLPS